MQNNAYKKQLIWNFNATELLDIFLRTDEYLCSYGKLKKRSLEGTGSSYDQKFVC